MYWLLDLSVAGNCADLVTWPQPGHMLWVLIGARNYAGMWVGLGAN